MCSCSGFTGISFCAFMRHMWWVCVCVFIGVVFVCSCVCVSACTKDVERQWRECVCRAGTLNVERYIVYAYSYKYINTHIRSVFQLHWCCFSFSYCYFLLVFLNTLRSLSDNCCFLPLTCAYRCALRDAFSSLYCSQLGLHFFCGFIYFFCSFLSSTS